MTTTNDKLREALLKFATENPGTYIVPGWDGDSVRRALAQQAAPTAQGWKLVKMEPVREWVELTTAEKTFLVYECVNQPLMLMEKTEESLRKKNASPSPAPAVPDAAKPETAVDLIAAAEDVCATLEHPTKSVTALQMWRLRESIAKKDAALVACVEAMKRMASVRLGQREPGYPPSDADKQLDAAIEQAKEAVK